MVYMGSKNRLAKHMLPFILKGRKPGQLYIEPFCGGCNVIDKVENPRIANDNNKYLIALLKAVTKDGWRGTRLSREMYYDIKANRQNYPDHVVGYAGFISSSRGCYFSGYPSEGFDYDKQENQLFALLKQVKMLNDVEFLCMDYRELQIPKDSIVYCDPPYKGTAGYTRHGVESTFDYASFWEWIRKISQYSSVFVSEFDAPEDFECIFSISLTHSIGNKQGRSIQKTEKLFRYLCAEHRKKARVENAIS